MIHFRSDRMGGSVFACARMQGAIEPKLLSNNFAITQMNPTSKIYKSRSSSTKIVEVVFLSELIGNNFNQHFVNLIIFQLNKLLSQVVFHFVFHFSQTQAQMSLAQLGPLVFLFSSSCSSLCANSRVREGAKNIFSPILGGLDIFLYYKEQSILISLKYVSIGSRPLDRILDCYSPNPYILKQQ